MISLKVHRGEQPSAEKWNAMVDLINRTITGPDVAQSTSGWHIRGRQSGVSASLDLCILRVLDVNAKNAMMQRVGYNEEELLMGEEKFYKHVVAIGSVFEVHPPPTFTYGMFNAQAALRPVPVPLPDPPPDPLPPPENLSNAILWWVNGRNEAWMAMKAAEDMVQLRREDIPL